ncbi:hypothetical protein NX059_012550 [Plenodomus lindquistii]|nr:hypothetical protein NX059_012550 [Plenodomus lindquistii]
MCYYRLFIFSGCGHSNFSATPVRYCANAISYTGSGTKRRKRSSDTGSTSPTGTATIDKTGETTPSQAPRHSRGTTATKNAHRIRKSSSRSTSPATGSVQPCAEGRAHPFNRVKLERLCAVCEYERDERLHALETSTDEVKFDPARWRWKYQGTNGVRTGKGDVSEPKNKGERGSGLWGVGTAVEKWWT